MEEKNMDSKQTLLAKGVIYFSGEFNKVNIDIVVQDILYLNEQDNVKEITLIINSPGGECCHAFALIDVMEMSKKPINTVGLGYICSCGLLTFMAGNKRKISDKAMILSHQYSGGKEGKYHELVGERKLEDYLNDRMIKHYKRHTGLPLKIITSKLLTATNVWLTPTESVKYGFADEVINKF